MTAKEVAALDGRLDRFLADLTTSLGRSERHRWAKVYLQGLLMEGARKSIEPLAGRIEGADVQSLRQFVGQSPWAVEQIQQKLAEKVVDLLAEPAVWMIEETSFPKAGDASVGVARQYCGVLGKVANCQVAPVAEGHAVEVQRGAELSEGFGGILSVSRSRSSLTLEVVHACIFMLDSCIYATILQNQALSVKDFECLNPPHFGMPWCPQSIHHLQNSDDPAPIESLPLDAPTSR